MCALLAESTSFVWYVAACGMGLAVGACVGILIHAIFAYWEGVKTSVKAVSSLLIFLLGGGGLAGGGATLFALLVERDLAAYYMIGAVVGVFLGYRFPMLPKPRLTPKMMTKIFESAIKAKQLSGPGVEQQKLLDLTGIQTLGGTGYQKQSKMDEDDLEARLAAAVDAMNDPEEEDLPAERIIDQAEESVAEDAPDDESAPRDEDVTDEEE